MTMKKSSALVVIFEELKPKNPQEENKIKKL